MGIIPEVQLRYLTRCEAQPDRDNGQVELLQASATRVFIAYHETAVLPANGRFTNPKPLDHYKVVAVDFNRQFQAWGLNYKTAANIPWAMRDTFLRAMAVEGVRYGVFSEVTLANGEVIKAEKPVKVKATVSGKTNGHANGKTPPPFDGGTFTKGKVTPPVQAGAVKAAPAKAKARKARGATA